MFPEPEDFHRSKCAGNRERIPGVDHADFHSQAMTVAPYCWTAAAEGTGNGS
jgi:hypothetical protein